MVIRRSSELIRHSSVLEHPHIPSVLLEWEREGALRSQRNGDVPSRYGYPACGMGPHSIMMGPRGTDVNDVTVRHCCTTGKTETPGKIDETLEGRPELFARPILNSSQAHNWASRTCRGVLARHPPLLPSLPSSNVPRVLARSMGPNKDVCCNMRAKSPFRFTSDAVNVAVKKLRSRMRTREKRC